jgi:hypothetical protein
MHVRNKRPKRNSPDSRKRVGDAGQVPKVIIEESRTITGQLLGDPMPGRSALDKERERERKSSEAWASSMPSLKTMIDRGRPPVWEDEDDTA